MPIRGEKTRKIKALKEGKNVRPPKKWWDEFQLKINSSKRYEKFSDKRRARIVGGIWSNLSSKAKIRAVKKYQR